MKIGMILDKTFPPDPRVENEAKALIKDGHEVFLFCLHYGNEVASEEINGINIRRYKSSRLEYKLSALAYTFPFYSYLMRKKIKNFVLENKVEALHIHDIRIAEAVFQVNKEFKLKTVLDLHDNFPEVMKEYPHLQKFPGKQLISPDQWKKKEEEFLVQADKIITVSNEFIEEIKSRADIEEGKIQLVPNTVSRSFYQDYKVDQELIDRYKEKFVILYLGDTGIRRGLLTVLNAVPELKKHIKQLKVVIVGSNTSDHVLKQRAKDLKIDDHVDFEGWQNIDRFPSYIIASDICVSPLNRSVQHDVAYANKIFQYMSFSRPVLVSDAIAQKRLVDRVQSGLVHREKDSEDFTHKVIELYNDEDLRVRLGANGKRFIEDEFCWEKVSANLCNLYKGFEEN